MYPEIKGITAAAPSSRTWDKMVARDFVLGSATYSTPASVETNSSNNTFEVRIRDGTLAFAIDLEYREFGNEIGSELVIHQGKKSGFLAKEFPVPVAQGELINVGLGKISCYRVLDGSNRDREWKPLAYETEYRNIVNKYATVGVQLAVKSEVSNGTMRSPEKAMRPRKVIVGGSEHTLASENTGAIVEDDEKAHAHDTKRDDNYVGETEDMGTIMEGDEEAHGPENNDAGGIEDGETPATHVP
ncbi:hypothetical protein Q9L58_008421 [Maublancomyces gigas]|uniref:Uncharacterized protein n=1 Tax=Discina gigas TaxID=1032678 RepID=A0ABR3G9T0_9PEZI